MLSIRQHMRIRRPPSPCVEDEIVSLSRELHGLSYLGEKPGVEGARARGSVDQFPILLTVDALSLPPLSHSTENTSDDSSGPPTPPSEARTDPVLRSLGDNLSLPKPSVDSGKFHSPSKQNFRKTSSSSRRSSQQPDPYQASSVTMKHNSPAVLSPLVLRSLHGTLFEISRFCPLTRLFLRDHSATQLGIRCLIVPGVQNFRIPLPWNLLGNGLRLRLAIGLTQRNQK